MVGVWTFACDSLSGNPGNTFDATAQNGDDGGQQRSDSSLGPQEGEDAPGLGADAFWAKDPPPQWCGPDGGATQPPIPTGTIDCPSDKNREGCPCTKEGEKQACWPGLRKNRNLGICKDGVATCQHKNEVTLQWGPCDGYVLPDPKATEGKRACMCFSEGEWKLKNTSPCFFKVTSGTTETLYSLSTVNSTGQCPTDLSTTQLPPPAPKEAFSENTLKVDCEGHFKLFFAIRAGDPKSPQPTDCNVMKVSTEADYPVKNQVTKFPDLPSWVATDSQCVKKFYDTGGYGEFSVVGKSWLCENIDNGNGGEYVFQRFTYCPLKCNETANKSLPECVNCTNGASGTF